MKNDNSKCKIVIFFITGRILFLFSFLFFSLIFTFSFFIFNFSSIAASPDAIAIRVVPNPNHYSPIRWYEEKGFTGAPQSLEVDGFEAVRDGRTVYVNAANVVDTDSDGVFDDVYTNIYLMSYTQNAESATVDIFGQVVSRWKFAANIIGAGNCSKATSKSCVYDAECGAEEYCISPKAKIIRDTKRLSDLADIEPALERYKDKNGYYPKLSSGSYLPNATISTWPSWQEALGVALGAPLPVDPVNKLGECGGIDFAPQTCWDENAKKFADSLPSNGSLDLPAGSSAYMYTASPDGSEYHLSLGFEHPVFSSGVTVGGTAGNGAPVISCGTLSGVQGLEFIGNVSANDPDGDGLKDWNIIPISPNNWSAWNGWEWRSGYSELLLETTNLANYRKVSANRAGQNGDYVFRVSVSDVKDNISTKECTIRVNQNVPHIAADNAVFVASSTRNINYMIRVQANTNFYPLEHSFIGSWPASLSDSFSLNGNRYEYLVSGKLNSSNLFNQPNTIYNFTFNAWDVNDLSSSANFNITITNSPPTIGSLNCHNSVVVGYAYECRINSRDNEGNGITYSFSGLPSGLSGDVNSGRISGTPTAAGTFNITITPRDEFGYIGTAASLNLSVTNRPPVLDHISCQDETRINQPYNCATIGNDQDNHTVSYNFSGLPAGLSGDASSGVISGSPSERGIFAISVTPVDEFGLSGATQSFELRVNTHCGDGVVQSTNDEGASEVCDDGNSSDDDSCTNSCEWTCRSSVIPDFMSTGKGDGILYGNNDNTTVLPTDTSVSSFTYLKLSGVLPTPYIWVANTGTDRISKIRTNNGLRRVCQDIGGVKDCFWEEGTWETRGQIIGTYDVGDDPSRTAVNVETGEVWVGNRNGYSVTKLDNQGVHKKTCGVGGVVRGVAIEENGDVWVASHSGTRVVKISGDDSDCAILQSISIFPHAPYGLSIDEDGILWAVIGQTGVVRINPATGTFTHYPSSGGYGITIDFDKNIWLGGHAGHALIKFNQTSLSTPQYYGPGYSGLGITLDMDGNIWASTYLANGIAKFTKEGGFVFDRPSGGVDAHGAAGDSYGQVWVVNHSTGNLRAYDLNGNDLGTFNAYPGTAATNAYTYSDMTGFNRAMLLRSGIWTSDPVDSGFSDQHWGAIEFQQNIPSSRQKVEIFVRASNDLTDLNTATWMDIGDWNSDANIRTGRYIQVKIKLRSNQRLISPVVWDLKTACN